MGGQKICPGQNFKLGQKIILGQNLGQNSVRVGTKFGQIGTKRDLVLIHYFAVR
jgi:hypothetical protein